MTVHQKKSRRKLTRGIKKKNKKSRRYSRGSDAIHTRIGKKVIKIKRGRGGIIKRKLLSEQYANIINVGKAKILNVVENKANIHYIRMNVLTKGAVIKTDKGTATITNRPAHEGFVCAKLIEK